MDREIIKTVLCNNFYNTKDDLMGKIADEILSALNEKQPNTVCIVCPTCKQKIPEKNLGFNGSFAYEIAEEKQEVCLQCQNPNLKGVHTCKLKPQKQERIDNLDGCCETITKYIEPLGNQSQFWCKGYDPLQPTIDKMWGKLNELIEAHNREVEE